MTLRIEPDRQRNATVLACIDQHLQPKAEETSLAEGAQCDGSPRPASLADRWVEAR